MTSFIDGTASIVSGALFEEGASENQCIISEELAVFNSINVGDTITITNPNNEEEAYELTVTGTFKDTSSNTAFSSFMPGRSSGSSDPANRIYMSYSALRSIVDASEASNQTVTDSETGSETQSEIMDIFRGLADDGKCVILVSHSSEVAELCDEKYELVKLQKAKSKKSIK